MNIVIKFSALRESRWYELVIRFVLGGAATVAAGVVAKICGPLVGGLFLAFPAILPASATMIEKHECKRKERLGLHGLRRGREVAALEACGTAIGSFGLIFVLATAVWAAVAVLIWSMRRICYRPSKANFRSLTP
jgi:uncharacterized membrane protein